MQGQPASGCPSGCLWALMHVGKTSLIRKCGHVAIGELSCAAVSVAESSCGLFRRHEPIYLSFNQHRGKRHPLAAVAPRRAWSGPCEKSEGVPAVVAAACVHARVATHWMHCSISRVKRRRKPSATERKGGGLLGCFNEMGVCVNCSKQANDGRYVPERLDKAAWLCSCNRGNSASVE